MKLTDENGGEYHVHRQMDFMDVSGEYIKNAYLIKKIEKPEKPANPMPELKPGSIVRRRNFNSGQKPEVIIIQEVSDDGLFTGINISRGWDRECFCLQQVIEVCYPRTIDVIWSREP